MAEVVSVPRTTRPAILVWGAGAIGGSVGAWLKRAGHDITFVDVVPEHVAAIRDPAQGLRITGPVEEFAVTTPAFEPAELSGTWQWIFLAVKAQHTEAATRALTPHLTQDGFVLRYRPQEERVDGLPGREGVFLPCSFWFADCLHLVGRKKEARELFERLLTLRNDLGLLSEEYDPVAKRQLGNFPQAFTHVALINSARILGGDEKAPA